MSKERLIIFDTTLRDGEQSPGASLGIQEKLEVAQALAHLKVDVIEAGFPISSPGDFEAVSRVAKIVGRLPEAPEICGLSRAVKPDIDTCWQAVKHAKRPRIHTFIATSDIHMERKLKKSRVEVLEMAVAAVKHAKRFCENVEFSPEDAVRSDFNFLCQAVEAAIDAGATTVNIPDTVGYAIPLEFGELIRKLINRVPNIHKAVVSVHCHNDLGLAVANSLSAVMNGARQVECTVNGIGERAGNASLEEIVMAVKTRRDLLGLSARIATREISKASRLVSKLTGMMVQPNKAIVGANAFAHSSGIHQDGVLKYRTTYEIMNPEDVGVEESALLLTARSGRNGLSNRLRHLGYHLNPQELDALFGRFKILADKKRYIFDDDLIALLEEGRTDIPQAFVLEYLNTSSGTNVVPTATVRLKREGRVFQEAACGDGPVDACCRAMDKITGLSPKLLDYAIHSVSSGKDAQGEVTVKVEHEGTTFTGRGTSTDIIEASAKAYLAVINRILALKERKSPKIQERI